MVLSSVHEAYETDVVAPHPACLLSFKISWRRLSTSRQSCNQGQAISSRNRAYRCTTYSTALFHHFVNLCLLKAAAALAATDMAFCLQAFPTNPTIHPAAILMQEGFSADGDPSDRVRCMSVHQTW